MTILQFKTQNQIFKEMILLVKKSFEEFDISNWEVRQLKQIFKVNHIKPMVLTSLINNNTRGRQYQNKLKTNQNIIKKYSTKQELRVRFSATTRQSENDTLETYSPEDILKLIKQYMQSDEGIKFLAGLNYAQYQSSGIQNADFTNDEENFQFMPYFECTFIYTDSWNKKINIISQVKEKEIKEL